MDFSRLCDPPPSSSPNETREKIHHFIRAEVDKYMDKRQNGISTPGSDFEQALSRVVEEYLRRTYK